MKNVFSHFQDLCKIQEINELLSINCISINEHKLKLSCGTKYAQVFVCRHNLFRQADSFLDGSSTRKTEFYPSRCELKYVFKFTQ